MIAQARTVDALVQHATILDSIPKADLRSGDQVLVETENSIYTIAVLEDSSYAISGGWFDRQGVSPARISIVGCTWGGSAVKRDVVAALGLRLEFGNRVVTTRIREVRLIRGLPPEAARFRLLRSRDLFAACYGKDAHLS